MSKNRFEQLIEYVINDEEAKAKELFHQIVVEKSRAIYEDLMDEDTVEEELEEDNAMGEEPTEIDTDMSEGDLGGNQAQDMIDDVEMEEQGMSEDDSDVEFDDGAEKAGKDLTHDIEDEHDDGELENRVVDLEDKLDELMAEFESLMGGEGGDSVSDMDGGDALSMDDTDTAEFNDEEMGMMEAVNLAKAPAPVTSEPAGTNTKSTNANNSGAKGAVASPVKMTGDTAQGRPAPKAGELIGKVQNTPASGDKQMSAAPKPVTAQASGVNTKTPFPKA
jgi:hypothetical protein